MNICASSPRLRDAKRSSTIYFFSSSHTKGGRRRNSENNWGERGWLGVAVVNTCSTGRWTMHKITPICWGDPFPDFFFCGEKIAIICNYEQEKEAKVTQPPMVACKMEAQLEHVLIACTFLTRSGTDLHAWSVLGNKVSASEPSRRFVKSALLVGQERLPTPTLMDFSLLLRILHLFFAKKISDFHPELLRLAKKSRKGRKAQYFFFFCFFLVEGGR